MKHCRSIKSGNAWHAREHSASCERNVAVFVTVLPKICSLANIEVVFVFGIPIQAAAGLIHGRVHFGQIERQRSSVRYGLLPGA